MQQEHSKSETFLLFVQSIFSAPTNILCLFVRDLWICQSWGFSFSRHRLKDLHKSGCSDYILDPKLQKFISKYL